MRSYTQVFLSHRNFGKIVISALFAYILNLITLFFCKVYYAKFPPGMEQRRVLLMYPLLSKLWLNLYYIFY